jgi:hypothetical protein
MNYPIKSIIFTAERIRYSKLIPESINTKKYSFYELCKLAGVRPKSFGTRDTVVFSGSGNFKTETIYGIGLDTIDPFNELPNEHPYLIDSQLTSIRILEILAYEFMDHGVRHTLGTKCEYFI